MERAVASRDRGPRLARSPVAPLALEARLVFDGEAMEGAQRWATIDGRPLDPFSTERAIPGPSEFTDGVASTEPAARPSELLDLSQLRATTELLASVDQAANDATALLRSLAARSDFTDLLRTTFGNAGTDAEIFNRTAEELRNAILDGQFIVKVELRGFAEMKGYLAAYAASAPDGTERIYLNRDWIRLGIAGEHLTQALLQELGHAFDQRLNGGRDSAGDEGELFARLAVGEQLGLGERLRLAGNDDAVVLAIDGFSIPAEHATVTFKTVYADNDSTTYTTSTNSIVIGASGIGANSFSFTSADPGQTSFSGNDIAGQLSYTLGGANYVINGVISRRATSNGVVDAFYFVETTVLGGKTSTGNAYLMVIPGRESAVVSSKNNQNAVGTDSAGVDTALNSFVSTQSTNADPVITSNGGGSTATTSVVENTTTVTTVTATDANASDTKTFSITGGADSAKFSINSSSGLLTFTSAPDFENPTDLGQIMSTTFRSPWSIRRAPPMCRTSPSRSRTRTTIRRSSPRTAAERPRPSA